MEFYFIFPAIILVLFVYSIFATKKHSNNMKKVTEQFINDNPGAVKIYTYKQNAFLAFAKSLISRSANILIETVNGEPTPNRFTEGFGSAHGIYVKPGENVLSGQAYVKKPGVVHRSVTTTYDLNDMIINVKTGGVYILKFENKQFSIEEL